MRGAMCDYPRFAPVNDPDVAYENYYGAHVVRLAFSIVDRWIRSPEAQPSDPIEIHERPQTTNPMPQSPRSENRSRISVLT